MIVLSREPVLLKAGFVTLKAEIASGTVLYHDCGVTLRADVRITRKRVTRPFRDNLNWLISHSPVICLEIVEGTKLVVPVKIVNKSMQLGDVKVIELELIGQT